jgi:hypothetical protein
VSDDELVRNRLERIQDAQVRIQFRNRYLALLQAEIDCLKARIDLLDDLEKV